MADAKEEMTARAEAKGWLDPISGSFSSSTSLFSSTYFIYSSCLDLSLPEPRSVAWPWLVTNHSSMRFSMTS